MVLLFKVFCIFRIFIILSSEDLLDVLPKSFSVVFCIFLSSNSNPAEWIDIFDTGVIFEVLLELDEPEDDELFIELVEQERGEEDLKSGAEFDRSRPVDSGAVSTVISLSDCGLFLSKIYSS